MSAIRSDRLNEELKKTISEIVRELKDPRLSDMTTMTDAQVTRDLRYAKIYVSVFPFEQNAAVMATLEQHNWFLRRALGQRIRNQLKTVPEIQFFLDDSLEYIEQIDRAMHREE